MNNKFVLTVEQKISSDIRHMLHNAFPFHVEVIIN